MATPTSAIQKIVTNKNKFEIKIRELENNCQFNRTFVDKKTNALENVLGLINTPLKTEMHALSLNTLERRVSEVFHGFLFNRKQKLLQMETIIESYKKLIRNILGILLFLQKTKKVIKSAHGLCGDEVLAIKFKDGEIKAKC